MSTHPTLRESILVSRLRAFWQRSQHLAAQSRVVTSLATLLTPLAIWRHTDDEQDRPQSGALANSRVANAASATSTRLSTAGRQSRVAGLAGAGRQFVEGSWLYRWLTAEPDQEVVVIDLRETFTVGPWLRLVQRALEWLLPAAVSSLLFRSCRRIHRIVTTRPVQLASIVLAFVAAVVLAFAAQLGDPSPALVGVGITIAVLALAGSRVTWTYEELRETRGYQFLADAFEPPEPPEPAMPEDGERETDEER